MQCVTVTVYNIPKLVQFKKVVKIFLICVAFFISIPLFVSANNKFQTIQNDVYQVMIDEPNLKLKRDSNALRRNAWMLLKKFQVIEKKCPITGNLGKRVVSLINTYILHYTLLNVYPCISFLLASSYSSLVAYLLVTFL